MDKEHRKLINDCQQNLIISTSNVEHIVNKLLEKNIINEWMKQNILDPTLDEFSKKKRLYQLIQGRGPNAFSVLCKTLEETKNIGPRNILKSSRTDVDIYTPNDELNTAVRNINLNNIDLEEPYVKIHPNNQRMDIYDKSHFGAYPMGSNPKGHALIININKVKGKDDRTGSNVDVLSLIKLFKCLGFIVQPEEDLTEKKIKEVFEEFINTCQNQKSNSVVVFIMSHGEAGKDSTRSSDILSADGIKINTDWIIEQFGSHKIPSSTPKLFFFQACRGNNSDFGYNKNYLLQNDSTINSNQSSVEDELHRCYENVFIAYATVPGYNAKRHPIDGSWFVQTFCEVIRKNAWQYDLNTLMTEVDINIRKLNCKLNGFQTTECISRGFNKKFYFNPGLYDINS